MKWTKHPLENNMTQFANLRSDTMVTPVTNPELWYQWYEIVKEDAPTILDTFIENTAAKMEVTVDYLMEEFL